MSLRSAKFSGSVSTLRSKSTRRSSSNLELIRELSTPPSGSFSHSKQDDEQGEKLENVDLDEENLLNLSRRESIGEEMNEKLLSPQLAAEIKEGGKKKKKRQQSGWAKHAQAVLPHVGMVFLCILYALGGATMFYFVERPQEHRVRNENIFRIRQARQQYLEEMWSRSRNPSVSEPEFRQQAMENLDSWMQIMFASLKDGGYMSHEAVQSLLDDANTRPAAQQSNAKRGEKPAQHTADLEGSVRVNATRDIQDMWSFMGALLFSATMLTTIGYGTIAPVTTEGRLLCVAFGILGIPLTLMTVADIGKFLGGGLKRLYRLWLKCEKRLRDNCCKRSATAMNDKETPADEVIENVSATKREDKELQSQVSKDENANAITPEPHPVIPEDPLGPESTTIVPASWIAILIVAYAGIGAVLFSVWEPWSLFESFYFCFITMTTVGFGDFVPVKEQYFAVALLYIVFGMAITTMSIDLVGSVYIKKIHYFGRHFRSAKKALGNVRDMIRYANFLKRRYGLTDQQIREMTFLPHFYAMQEMLTKSGAYMPGCYNRLYYIDQGTESMLEEIFSTLTATPVSQLDIEFPAVEQSRSPTTTLHSLSLRGKKPGSSNASSRILKFFGSKKSSGYPGKQSRRNAQKTKLKTENEEQSDELNEMHAREFERRLREVAKNAKGGAGRQGVDSVSANVFWSPTEAALGTNNNNGSSSNVATVSGQQKKMIARQKTESTIGDISGSLISL